MDERKRMTAADREILNTLFAMSSIADHCRERFKLLCERVPNAWRDFRLAETKINGIIEKILYTVPIEQLRTVKNHMEMATIHIGVKCAGERPKDHWLMTYDDVATLAAFATDVKCFSCMDYNGPCKLREVLKTIPIEVMDRLVVPCWKE